MQIRPRKRNVKKASRFHQLFLEFLSQSQVQGYKFIAQTDRPLIERVLWICIAIIGIALASWFVISSNYQFVESPTVTSEIPIRKSVLEMSFPAVIVCNANRISRKSLLEFANFVHNATQYLNIAVSVDDIIEDLLLFGQMYTFDWDDDDLSKMNSLHTLLKTVYGGKYPMYEILTKLAPKCNETVKACKWQGYNVDCAKTFSTRKSYMGPCCVFNYKRPVVSVLATQQNYNHTIPRLQEPERVTGHGFDLGLTFLIDHQLDDYAFTMNSFTGVVVLIHDSLDYPDRESGAVKEEIISPNQEVFVTVHPTLIYGSKSMRTFNISSRNCVFHDEINLVYANFYSLSECLLTCRVSDLIEMCGCHPPQMTNLFNSTECSLDALPCLHSFITKWHHYEAIVGKGGSCPECIPKCNYIQHVIHSSSLTLDPFEAKKKSHDPKFINSSDIGNHSIVHVNFGSDRATSYEQTASYVWYELMANLGAVGSLSLGATMVSIIEIVYFLTGKLGAIWIRSRVRNGLRIRTKFDYVN